jgi:hypothetical protein
MYIVRQVIEIVRGFTEQRVSCDVDQWVFETQGEVVEFINATPPGNECLYSEDLGIEFDVETSYRVEHVEPRHYREASVSELDLLHDGGVQGVLDGAFKAQARS